MSRQRDVGLRIDREEKSDRGFPDGESIGRAVDVEREDADRAFVVEDVDDRRQVIDRRRAGFNHRGHEGFGGSQFPSRVELVAVGAKREFGDVRHALIIPYPAHDRKQKLPLIFPRAMRACMV